MFEQVLRLKYQHVGTCPSFLVSIGNLCLPCHLTNGFPPLLPPHPPSPPAMAIAAIRKERQLCQNSFERTHDSSVTAQDHGVEQSTVLIITSHIEKKLCHMASLT